MYVVFFVRTNKLVHVTIYKCWFCPNDNSFEFDFVIYVYTNKFIINVMLFHLAVECSNQSIQLRELVISNHPMPKSIWNQKLMSKKQQVEMDDILTIVFIRTSQLKELTGQASCICQSQFQYFFSIDKIKLTAIEIKNQTMLSHIWL